MVQGSSHSEFFGIFWRHFRHFNQASASIASFMIWESCVQIPAGQSPRIVQSIVENVSLRNLLAGQTGCAAHVWVVHLLLCLSDSVQITSLVCFLKLKKNVIERPKIVIGLHISTISLPSGCNHQAVTIRLSIPPLETALGPQLATRATRDAPPHQNSGSNHEGIISESPTANRGLLKNASTNISCGSHPKHLAHHAE